MQGIRTVSVISFRKRFSPRNHLGSVSTEMQEAPAASYSFAISRYGKSGAISPLEGDAFLHSQIKPMSVPDSACSKGNTCFSGSLLRISHACFSISFKETCCFSCSTRFLVSSAIFCNMVSAIFLLLSFFIPVFPVLLLILVQQPYFIPV